jgi:hypothetical protein
VSVPGRFAASGRLFFFSFFYRRLAQGLGHDPVRFSAAVSYNEKAEHPPLFSKKGIILRTFYL